MKNWPLVILFLIFQSCAVTSMNGQQKDSALSPEQANIKVHKKVFPNGLTALVVENNHLPIVSYYSFFDVGARNEPSGRTGSSHFLEHLLFKGTKKYPAGLFDKLIEGGGGSSNAYTSFDLTVYHEKIPKETLDLIMNIESDRMRNAFIAPEVFEKERNVILEERKYRYENSPQGQLYLKTMQRMNRGNLYGGSVIGAVSDLKKVTLEQIYDYYKKYYNPSNLVLAIVGDVKADNIFDKIEKLYGPYKGVSKLKKRGLDAEDFKQMRPTGRVYVNEGQSRLPLFIMAFAGVRLGHPDSYAFDILSKIWGEGESSHLGKTYVYGRRNFIQGLNVHHYNLKHAGLLLIVGQALGAKNLTKFKQHFEKQKKNICLDSINLRSVQKAKNQLLLEIFSELQTNSGVAEMIGNYEVLFGDYRYYEKELAAYKDLSVDDVRRICQRAIEDNYDMFVVYDSPKKLKL